MRIITLAIAFLICTASDAQIIRAEPFYTAPEEAVSGNLLLDDYPGAAVAYSLRKLDKDYTGSAIRVRRSSDNTEQDIGFVNDYLDTATMKTFVGNNNGFVVTWYNQADSAGVFGTKNVSQSTAGNQPQIMSSGSVILKNSKPTIYFDNDARLQRTSITAFSEYSLFTVFAVETLNPVNFGVVGSFSLSSGNAWGVRPTLNLYDYDGGISVVLGNNSITLGEQILFASILTNSSKTIYKNSGVNATAAGTSISCYDIIIGNNGLGGVNDALKNIQSVIVYPSDQSSNRTAIESNINSFYSIY